MTMMSNSEATAMILLVLENWLRTTAERARERTVFSSSNGDLPVHNDAIRLHPIIASCIQLTAASQAPRLPT
ncbi:hypothetical protein DFJ73DRAFT_883450 [Zopfochytrium polystomum]|nr:hypothetical protein DFJ73DRAFT_883450 [Zopfochytrium polystomum]